jgi:hypothetical protein
LGAHAKRRESSWQSGVAEWDAASKGKHLPERKMKKHKMKKTHITHHKDGSHTVEHEMEGAAEPESMAQPNDAALMAHMGSALGGEAPAAPMAGPPAA